MKAYDRDIRGDALLTRLHINTKQTAKLNNMRGEGLSVWKKQLLIYFEIIGYFVIGFILTENVLRYIYEYFNIPFMGNVELIGLGSPVVFLLALCMLSLSLLLKVKIHSNSTSESF